MKHTGGDARMESVFVVQHRHTLPGGIEDWKMIGVYRTQVAAHAAIDRLAVLPGFANHPNIIDPHAADDEDGFDVSERLLDSDSWTEGFVTMVGDQEYVP